MSYCKNILNYRVTVAHWNAFRLRTIGSEVRTSAVLKLNNKLILSFIGLCMLMAEDHGLNLIISVVE